MTDSGTLLGLTTAARYLPVLVFVPYARVLVDRFPKRKILLFTQVALGVVSPVLGLDVLAGTVELWHVFVLALAFGTLSAVDNPARLAFVGEVVPTELIRNAVTLNSTTVNVGRAIGPAIAGVLVATVGIGWCFLVNAASFGAVVVSLLSLDKSELHPSVRPARARGQLRAGFRYARATPAIYVPLLMIAAIGTFTYEFEVSLPLFARDTWHGSSTTCSWLIGAFGVGAVAGGLYSAARPRVGLRPLTAAAGAYAITTAATALAPTFLAAIAILVLVGGTSVMFLTTGNSTIQLAAKPPYRERVIALWSTAFIGSTPIGSPIIGALAEHAGVRWGPRPWLGRLRRRGGHWAPDPAPHGAG